MATSTAKTSWASTSMSSREAQPPALTRIADAAALAFPMAQTDAFSLQPENVRGPVWNDEEICQLVLLIESF